MDEVFLMKNKQIIAIKNICGRIRFHYKYVPVTIQAGMTRVGFQGK